MPLLSHGRSDPGCVRQQNEDRIFWDDAMGLYVVCDGIGGRRCGDVAAQVATDTIRESVERFRTSNAADWPSQTGIRLVTAVKMANREVWRRGEESLQYLGMGATVAAVLVERGTAAVANIGDSRVYLLRAGVLERLSVDDSTSLGTGAAIRTLLTRSAGEGPDVDVHLKEFELTAGDLLLLCSDGLHGYIPEDRIASIAAGPDGIGARTHALIAATRSAGAPDNVSAVLVQYRSEP